MKLVYSLSGMVFEYYDFSMVRVKYIILWYIEYMNKGN